MKTIHYIFTFFILIAAISCEKEIEFNGGETKPLLVINGIIETGKVIEIRLTESKFFLDSDVTPYKQVEDATVKLEINGEYKETLQFKVGIFGSSSFDYGNNPKPPVGSGKEVGFYASTYQPRAGDKIRITASSAKFDEVSANFEMPEIVPIISIDTTNYKLIEYPIININFSTDYDEYGNPIYSELKKDTTGYYVNERFDIKITFQDKSEQQNFYQFKLNVKDVFSSNGASIYNSMPVFYISKESFDNGYFNYGVPYYTTSDIVFNKKNNQSGGNIFDNERENNPYMIFSDELINGKKYSINISVLLPKGQLDKYKNPVPIYAIDPERRELHLELMHITKDYFYYLRSEETYMNQELLFSEPVQIYTNIKGGAGLIGAFSILPFIHTLSNY